MEEEERNKEKRRKESLHELIEELTTSGNPKLEEKSLKSLKKMCKKSQANIPIVYHMIVTQMEKEHSEIRLSCFQLINELFLRSHMFRQLILDNFQEIMELCLEINEERKLPPPKNAAKLLKSTALSNIEIWQQKFGLHYKKLELAYDYLKRVKKVDFAGISSRTLNEQRRQELHERRQKEIELRSIEKIDKEMKEMCLDIESAILQCNNCMNLILPRPFDLYTNEHDFVTSSTKDKKLPEQNLNEEDNTTVTDREQKDRLSANVGRYHGISAKSYNLTITIPIGKTVVTESNDNADLLKSLQDVIKEIKHKFLPVVNRWATILVKCSGVHEKLEKCMQLKDKMKELIDKFREIEITQSSKSKKGNDENGGCDSYSEDEEFIAVPESETFNLRLEAKESDQHGKGLSSVSTAEESCTKQQLKKGFEKPFDKAPVVTFDNDLKYWGSNKLHITPITKNDSLHKFWSQGEHEEEFVPKGLEESLRSRAMPFTGTFEPVKWKCRVPMPNGKLCERQDRVKCPFHGKIVARNEHGEPSNAQDREIEAERKRKKVEEEAEEIRKDVEIATGNDLGSSSKKMKGKSANNSKSRYARLTNLDKIVDTNRRRLEKKVLSVSAIRRVEEATSAIEKRRNLEKFGSNFNYHYER